MTAEARVFRFVDHAHAPATEFSDNAIVGDCLADHSEGLSAVGDMLGRERRGGQPVKGRQANVALMILRLPVIFQEVVHSIGTREADCDGQSSFRGQTECLELGGDPGTFQW